VLTHVDDSVRPPNNFAHDICENYITDEATTEERNVLFLRILTKILFALEVSMIL
jgi:hypothetical protein